MMLRPICVVLASCGAAALHHGTPSRAYPTISRRNAIFGFSSLLATPQASFALFESQQQLALNSLATAQPKVRSLINEVTEVKRRRVKMAIDTEDDAYVFRFARSVLDPQVNSMEQAAAAIQPDAAARLLREYREQLAALDAGCRSNAADSQLDALGGLDRAISEFLDLASKSKYDVRPREDINGCKRAPALHLQTC